MDGGHGAALQGSGHRAEPTEVQEVFGHHSWIYGWNSVVPARSQELDWMIPVGPFQLRMSYDIIK